MKRIDNYLNYKDEPEFFQNKASDAEIEQAEEQLGVIFDKDYKEFIKRYGGCYVGVDVYAFKNASDLSNKTVIDLTLFYRDQEVISETGGFYTISFDGSGNPIILNQTGEVVMYDHDNGEFIVEAASFEELIEANLPD